MAVMQPWAGGVAGALRDSLGLHFHVAQLRPGRLLQLAVLLPLLSGHSAACLAGYAPSHAGEDAAAAAGGEEQQQGEPQPEEMQTEEGAA